MLRPLAALAVALTLVSLTAPSCRSGAEDPSRSNVSEEAPSKGDDSPQKVWRSNFQDPGRSSDPALDEAAETMQEDPPPTAPAGNALGSFGPREPERWRVLEPGQDDTFALMRAGESPTAFEDTIVQASTRTAVICFQGRGPFRGVTLRNSILRVEPGTLPLDRSYWAFRGYDMIDTLVEDTEITGFGVVTPKHDEGHAIYLNVAGAFTVRGSHLHHNGGQAIQLVNRPAESVLPAGPAAGEIRIENTRIAENGFNPDRGGFQVSIFGTGQPVVFRDVEIVAGLDDTEHDRGRTSGGLLIEAEDPNAKRGVWWKPRPTPEDWEVPFTQGPTHLQRVTIRHRDPNKPIVQVKGCEELLVEDCWFEGGKVVLDHPAKPGRDSGRIVWRDNGGDADLYVRGRRVGRVDQDYEF